MATVTTAIEDLARRLQLTQPAAATVRNQAAGPADGSPAATEMSQARNDASAG